MNWKQQLTDMEGKTFLHHGQPETVVKHIAHSDERVEILTDAEDYEMPASEVPTFLASFVTPAAPATRPARRTTSNGPAYPAITPTVSDTSKLKLMQEALLNALARVQQDEAYVPQAEQTARLVQVGINLARLELDAMRLARA
jgi:hypothetical protein